jgi:hypothetical protein
MNYIRYIINEISGAQSGAQTTQPTPLFTPIEQAQFNASDLTLPGFEGRELLTAGGVSKEVANSSGNKITLTGQDYTRRRQGLD